jgi:hypothetical protein
LFILDALILHRLQYSLLFLLLWSRMAGELSFERGILLYAALFTAVSLLRFPLKRLGMKALWQDMLPPALLLLLLPLVRLMIPLAALLPFPGNLYPLRLFLYLLPILPYVVLFHALSGLALRFRPAHLAALALYLGATVLLLSRRGWGLVLSGGSLAPVAAVLYLFLLLELLLILSAGRRDGGLSLFPGLFLLILLPLLALLPVNRLYEQESRTEGGGLLESSLFRFDFSDYLSLESSISMKRDLVFLMRLEGPGEDWRIRRFVLSAFDGEKGFFRDGEAFPEAPGLAAGAALVGESPRSWDDGPDYENRERMEQEYYLVNFDAGAFLGLNRPVGVTPYENWDSSSFSRIYAVDSEISRAWGWELMDDEALPADAEPNAAFLEYYSRWNGDEALKDLAEEITAGRYGYYARVKALEEYLQDEYYYSLEPGSAPDGNQLNYFLFDAGKGYCSYFAFAMTMLCRSLGIPARVALGFWVPANAEILNFYPVRADQAHAWVEVYFPRFGWIEFDPTSTTPAPGEEYPFSSPSPEELEGYLKEILENRDSLEIQDRRDAGGSAGGEGRFRIPGPGRFALSGAAALLLLSLFAILRLRYLLRPPRRKSEVSGYFHLHLALSGCSSRMRHSGDDLRSFVNDRGPEELGALLEGYERIRFGRSSLADLRRLEELGRALRRRLFTEQGPGGRLHYLLRLILFRRPR